MDVWSFFAGGEEGYVTWWVDVCVDVYEWGHA